MSNNSDSFVSCGCMFLIVVFNLLLGAWSINYLLMFFLAKTIPLIAAIIIGLFAGEFTIPLAIVVWILHACGIM